MAPSYSERSLSMTLSYSEGSLQSVMESPYGNICIGKATGQARALTRSMVYSGAQSSTTVASYGSSFPELRASREQFEFLNRLEHLKISLDDIKSATSNFDKTKLVGLGGYGEVYSGVLPDHMRHGQVAVKRLDPTSDQGSHEFLTEVSLLSACKHENVISLIGFCNDNGEKILVYEYAANGSLDGYLRNTIDGGRLSWVQRLKICIDVANGLNYLHNYISFQYRIIHRDIKSSNILLNENFEAKISDFGLSKIAPANAPHSILVSNVAGTPGYVAPEYQRSGILTKESDVYSLGVLLFEVLCGRPAVVNKYRNERRFLAELAQRSYIEQRIETIVGSNIREQINPTSLWTFTTIAYRCLNRNQRGRPRIAIVVEELTKALDFQVRNVSGPVKRIKERWLAHMEYLHIPLEEIKMATNFFGEQNLIGDGTYSITYRGALSGSRGHTAVAVKRWGRQDVYSGKQEFYREILILSNYTHKNLVPIVGLCTDEGEMIIVYKLATNGALDRYLMGDYRIATKRNHLTWAKRLHICVGIARGLQYLHSGNGQDVMIHCDVKSTCILLDENWEPMLGNFTQSRICPSYNPHVLMNPRGTLGYIDPEFLHDGILTKESDVYSFGVVLLEVLCGRKSLVDMRHNDSDYPRYLVPWARPFLERGKVEDILDKTLRKEIAVESLSVFSRLAYECTREVANHRPTMTQVVEELEAALTRQQIAEL